jgi:hypothetical protein
MRIITNNMAIIIVFRINGIWLFNLTLSHNLSTIIKRTFAPMLKVALTVVAMFALSVILIACQSPTSANDKASEGMVSLRYVADDSLSVSCWYPSSADPQRDSLKVGSKRYTISKTSRYRADTLPSEAPKDANGDWEDEGELDAKLNECEADFLQSILEDYRIMLKKEYEYRDSDEYITETILANDYEFDENGNRDK